MPPQILCVDDDPAIRETLPAILNLHGFDTVCAATVTEALTAITSQQFDVLISDLNIGTPGDGFAVVSAMRSTQPDCVTFILTGYPALETALQTIRQQVDEYLIKPVDARVLVSAINNRIAGSKQRNDRPHKRVSAILREHADEIVEKYLNFTKQHEQLGALPLSDEERLDDFRHLLALSAERLDTEPGKNSSQYMSSAAARGAERYAQHYPIVLIVESQRILEKAIYQVIYDHLLEIDLSYLLLDLGRLREDLLIHLGETLRVYEEHHERDLA
jgi:ActR/RegA family two-component response regulator